MLLIGMKRFFQAKLFSLSSRRKERRPACFVVTMSCLSAVATAHRQDAFPVLHAPH